MKNKKKIWKIVFGVICAIIVGVCVIIQIIFNQKTEKLKQEGEKLETLVTQTKSGETIETEYTQVEDNKFFIKIPTKFQPLDAETIAQKYSGDVPDIVFSNEETTINVAIRMTENEMSNSQINSYRIYMEEVLKNNSEIVESKTYEVDNHKVGKIKLITQAEDTEIYNNMICFSYQGKLVIITFNCTKELKEDWQEVGDFIIDSLFFTE